VAARNRVPTQAMAGLPVPLAEIVGIGLLRRRGSV
jgi:hypothetical protein